MTAAISKWTFWLDRLDEQKDFQFVLFLYLARWAVLAPWLIAVALFGGFIGTSSEFNQVPFPALVFGFLILSPLLETFIECWLPYTVMRALRKETVPRRWWTFIAVSAAIMALLHPTWSAVPPSLITGAFLAYCYAHFAVQGQGKAFLFTAGFHAAINLVGATIILFSRL